MAGAYSNMSGASNLTTNTTEKPVEPEKPVKKKSKGSNNKNNKPGEKKGKHQREIIKEHTVISSEKNKYRVIKLLGSGGFGDVYKVFCEKTKKEYALKTEEMDIEERFNRLKVELKVLETLNQEADYKHYLSLIDRGQTSKMKFIVMPLLGPSLDVLKKTFCKGRQFTPSTALRLSIQTLAAIRQLHEAGFIHRDIKPANFAAGMTDPEFIFILDFGIAKPYLDENNNHILPRESTNFIGTVRYASRNALCGKEQSRRDDMESWAYMICDFWDDRTIPWGALKKPSEELVDMKEDFFELFAEQVALLGDAPLNSNIPYEIRMHIFPRVNCLRFYSVPHYDFYHMVLLGIMKNRRIKITPPMEWVLPKTYNPAPPPAPRTPGASKDNVTSRKEGLTSKKEGPTSKKETPASKKEVPSSRKDSPTPQASSKKVGGKK